MTDKDLMEVREDMLKCEQCIFNENCEGRFTGCIANVTNDFLVEDITHLRYCETQEYDTLNKDEQDEFNNELNKLEKEFNELSEQ